MEDKIIEKKEEKIGLSKYRFIIVIIYCMENFSNAVHWVTYASCAKNFSKFYNLSSFKVDIFSMIYMIVYPIVCVPESHIIDNINLRLGLSIAGILTILGSLLKCFININIIYAYIGQFLIAIFQPAILNSPAKIASTWFDEKNRIIITSICCASNTIGIMFGYLVHTFVFDDNITSEKIFKVNFEKYAFVEFIGTFIFCFPLLIFMRNKPKIPPSKSQDKYVSPPVTQSLKLLFSNRNFLKLLISTTCIVGFFNIFGTIINEFLFLYNINDEQTTLIAAISNISGILGSLIIGKIIDKNKKYKFTMILLNIFGIIFLSTATILLEFIDDKYHFYISIICYTLVIIACVPFYTTGMDFVCELTYPVGESISEGLIMSSNQISGIIGIVIWNIFKVQFPQYKFLTNIMFIIMFLISLVSLSIMEVNLVRTKKDKGEDDEETNIKDNEDKNEVNFEKNEKENIIKNKEENIEINIEYKQI